jgi:hypothetical protein
MTDQHPLTDSFLQSYYKYGDGPYDEDQMRDVADRQLDQVIEWMEVNLMKHDFYEGYAYLYDDCSQAYIREEELLEDLREAMRPTTTTQENNND